MFFKHWMFCLSDHDMNMTAFYRIYRYMLLNSSICHSAFNSRIGSPQQITGTPLSFTFSTMFPQCLQIQYLTSMPFSPSMCKIYNSIVSIIFFNESADSLSFNASSPLKLIGISDSIPSAPTIAGILNDTPSISYTP